ncbi:Polynucleotide 5'-hydroxyl-kinase GRC3 [Candida viswanathii]|uniref:Polynucleotide 5'-hydroxyl-kinase GRC3 n=1 Tax=Candida viswanathii TaxID=5486 RepID=A0A367XZX9_9ASCO|nr:Polynucleotide 5'-hydroxyl-kinase GRC3 [Candida viswanathii]
MSAFAALKGNSNGGSIFNTEEEQTDDDEGIIQYQANSSDEDEIDDDEGEEDSPDYGLLLPPQQPPASTSSTPITQTARITQSNFIPTQENLQFQEGSVMVTLCEPSEYLLVSGQCRIKIILGEIILNNCHVLEAGESDTYDLIGLQSQSLPIIAYHGQETTFELSNLYNGLENIGNICKPLRNLIKQEDNEDSTFKDYSFEIVFSEQNGICGLDINPAWIDELTELKSSYHPLKIMIIGNKNTGKSTFCKTLLNELLLGLPQASVDYLDLDPGQSEHSHPYTLSLSKITEPQFGFNSSNHAREKHDHYFGFTSSIHSPTRYIKIIEDLYSKYDGKNHLIVNTPGYIKGFGKELLNEITKLIQPDRLIVLSNNLSLEYPDNTYLLQDLQYEEVKILPGIYQLSKYSAPEIRSINKLLYFHEAQTTSSFDFSKRLLDVSPLKLSYSCPSQPIATGAVSSVTVLNFDIPKDFNIGSLLEVTICGVYLMKQTITLQAPANPNLPYFLNQKEFDNVFATDSEFAGLVIIHSINPQSHYMNIYAPHTVVSKLQNGLKQGSRVMLVKGDGEVPSCEILHPDLVNLKVNSIKQKRKSKDCKVSDFKFPYVNFEEKKIKIGGVWKVRKNIMRRSHNHQRG